jgi:hypothetical protein
MSDAMTDEWYEQQYSKESQESWEPEDTSWDSVIIDMIHRNKTGYRKYGRYLRPNQGDDMLQHAYEEALDLAVYLKTAILERDQPALFKRK